jgi:hypothetical protein
MAAVAAAFAWLVSNALGGSAGAIVVALAAAVVAVLFYRVVQRRDPITADNVNDVPDLDPPITQPATDGVSAPAEAVSR